MTVDPRLQLTPGEYLIHPDGSASKVVDRRNMTVDEILATGTYTDRRGREWVAAFESTRGDRYWVSGSHDQIIDRDQMRLLIERDQHRGECPGLAECSDHPVWVVSRVYSRFRVGGWEILGPHKNQGWLFGSSHSEAMDAARALAVGG